MLARFARTSSFVFGVLLTLVALAPGASQGADFEAPGLGDPGKLESVTIGTGREKDGAIELCGGDASQQLVVTGHYSSGQLRDLTRDVAYEISPAGIIQVDPTGHVLPVTEGEATIHVTAAGGLDANLKVHVTGLVHQKPINFPNQIVPIFTKYGCNGGGCHGKSSGQNGFRLSLLGFEPTEDYEHLVLEGRGRRLFPAAPDRSLLLEKAVSSVPHGGGHRFAEDSPSYRLIRRWIAQGMPYGNDDDPTVTHVEVIPRERLLNRGQSQQLTVVAHYTNGDTEDVTRMAQFESNDGETADVNETGLVTTGELTGSAAVMIRYQGNVDVFRATVPLGLPVENLPKPKNFIDELVFKKLIDLGLPPSDICDDATFLRRVTIDVAGRLPTLEESEKFLADKSPDKRAEWIDRLLASGDYADFFAGKWGSILRNKRRADTDKPATYAFHSWIRQALYENMPYDEFAAEILSASGDLRTNPAVAWYREVRDQAAQVEDTAQLFLGVRIQCARCHHHPFEKWSQQDYYGFAAFFSQVSRKPGNVAGTDRIYHKPGQAKARNPKTNQDVLPTGLGDDAFSVAADEDPRVYLADWMGEKDNSFFSSALVNRYWKHFFGRGLVDPEDDMRVTNPACNPELLDGLAKDFVDSGFDLKHLVRTICNSQVYQLSSEPNQYNANDKQNFSRHYPQRLNAEILLDAIDQVTASQTAFVGVPRGTRATQLPDTGFNSYFLTVFGRPESSSACECERSGEANLAQSLHLLNSQEIQGKLTSGSGRAALLSGDKETPRDEQIRQLYLLAFSREPTSDEVGIATAYIEKAEDPRRALEDILWALINTKEFLFNH